MSETENSATKMIKRTVTDPNGYSREVLVEAPLASIDRAQMTSRRLHAELVGGWPEHAADVTPDADLVDVTPFLDSIIIREGVWINPQFDNHSETIALLPHYLMPDLLPESECYLFQRGPHYVL